MRSQFRQRQKPDQGSGGGANDEESELKRTYSSARIVSDEFWMSKTNQLAVQFERLAGLSLTEMTHLQRDSVENRIFLVEGVVARSFGEEVVVRWDILGQVEDFTTRKLRCV
jgi:hypothetical protein